MNFVITDGVSVVATRYVRSGDSQSAGATLYYASGTSFEPVHAAPSKDDNDTEHQKKLLRSRSIRGLTGKQISQEDADCSCSTKEESCPDYKMVHRDRRDKVVIITSEPLTDTEQIGLVFHQIIWLQ